MMKNDNEAGQQITGNLTNRIVESLGRAIVAGDYEDRPFPIEADIAKQFAASRSVTREAIKMLTAKGLIASRPRLGTSIAPEHSWNFLDPDVLRWLLNRGLSLDLLAEFTAFRSAIEPKAAMLAIRRNHPAEIANIEAAIDRMAQTNGDDAKTLQADIDFHVAILLASGNRFMIQCRDLVETALRFSIRLTNRQKGVDFADIEAHRAIAHAIVAGDADRAVNASRDLLNEAAMLIERARSQPPA
jgi:DNA-binding FadR family transcriptional regulator